MKKENWAIAGSILAGLVLVGFLAAPSLLRGPPRNSETLCLETGAVGHTLILVDKSDPWSEVQANRLKQLVRKIGADLPADRMISINVFNDSFEPGFPPLIALCNPGRTVSEWIGNPRRDYLRWRERFGKPLDDALTTLVQPAKGNLSPIVEAIGDVVSRRENRPAGEKTIVLISDMLQNSPGFSIFSPQAANRDPDRLQRLVEKTWRDGGAQDWRLQIHQVLGGYDRARLEQAEQLWRPALSKSGISFTWERL